MRKISIPAVVLTLFVAAIVSAQSMVESAVAAAGGSAAGVAGKKVSDGFDAVFGKVGGAIKNANEQGNNRGRLAPAVPRIPTVRLTEQETAPPTLDGKARPAAGVPAKRQATLQPASAPQLPDALPEQAKAPAEPVPARPEPTAADLQSLTAGASREDVVGKMGKPASRITMSEDNKLVEIYRFKNQSGALGSVRVVDGKVEKVNPAQ